MTGAPPTPTAATEYSTWLPDLKWTTYVGCTFASGVLLAGFSSWFHIDLAAWLQPVIDASCASIGIKPAPGAQFVLSLVIGAGLGWWKKAGYRDIVKYLTPALLHRASQDANVNSLAPSGINPNVLVVEPVPSAPGS